MNNKIHLKQYKTTVKLILQTEKVSLMEKKEQKNYTKQTLYTLTFFNYTEFMKDRQKHTNNKVCCTVIEK